MLQHTARVLPFLFLALAILPIPLRAESKAEAKIRAALNNVTTIEVIETPLTDVCEYLQDLHGVPILLDTRSLDDAGISTDTPFTMNLDGVSLRSVLHLLLERADLTWTIRHEALLITTKAGAARLAEVRVFDVSELLAGGETGEVLAKVVQNAVGEPPLNGMAATKSSSSYQAFGNKLIVRATEPELDRVVDLLKKLATEPPAQPILQQGLAPEIPPRIEELLNTIQGG